MCVSRTAKWYFIFSDESLVEFGEVLKFWRVYLPENIFVASTEIRARILIDKLARIFQK